VHQPKAHVDRLYVKREGVRGVLLIEPTYKAQIISTVEYFNTKYTGEEYVNIVKSHASIQPCMNSTINLLKPTGYVMHQ